MESPAHGPSEPLDSAQTASRVGLLAKLRDICWEMFTGVIVVVLLVSLKIRCERTVYGESLDWASYVILQEYLSPTDEAEDLPCLIINISGIHPTPRMLDNDEVPVTPRDRLTPLIEAVIRAEPKAVGIDIDFSAWKGNPVTPEDGEIFDAWKKMAREHNVGLYFGVQRARAANRSDWLPSSTLADNAAAITEHDKYVRYHIQWISAPDAVDRLIGMGPALAGRREVLDDASDHISNSVWMASILTEEWSSIRHLSDAQYALTDYSFLPELRKTMFSANTAGSIKDNAEKLRGKIVLLGNASLEEGGADTFQLPFISDRPVPGVFLHACAALTELQSPLREFTPQGRLLLDGVLSGSILAIASLIRMWNISRPKSSGLSPENVEALLLFASAFLVVASGLIVVRWSRLIWTDFALVAIALLLHRWFHAFLHHTWTILLLVGKEIGRIFQLAPSSIKSDGRPVNQ